MQVIKTLPLKHLLIFCVAAALPLLLMSLLFNFPLASGGKYFPGTSQLLLGDIIHSAFLAAASGILPLMPLLFSIKHKMFRLVPKIIFAVSGFVCAWFAHAIAGTTGMLFYVVLVFITYGGGTLLIFNWLSSVTRTFLTLLRWSVALFIYVTLQLHLNLEVDIAHWKQTTAAVEFGALYFYILTVLEVVLYPPLTWYLEYRLQGEQRYSLALDGFGQTLG